MVPYPFSCSKIQAHPGNQHMLSLVNHYHEEYDRISRSEKFRIIDDIMSRIRQRGGRFMEYAQSKQHWEEVSRAAAYNKVSHAFRSLRRANLPPETKKRPQSDGGGGGKSKISTISDNLNMPTMYDNNSSSIPGIPAYNIHSTMEEYGASGFPLMPAMGEAGNVGGLPGWGTAPTHIQSTAYWVPPPDPEGKVAGIDSLDTSHNTGAVNDDDAQNICEV
jgi:hypothetical protein